MKIKDVKNKALGDRIKACREKLHYTQQQVAEIAGITQQSYQVIEAGGVKNPREIEKIAEALGTSGAYLRFGNLNRVEEYNLKINKAIEHHSDNTLVPLHNEENIINKTFMPIDAIWIKKGNYTNKELFAFCLHNDSLRHEFNIGDILIFERSDKKILPGQTVLSIINHEIIIGKYKIMSNDEFEIIPYNSDWGIHKSNSQKIEIIGVLRSAFKSAN